MTKTAIQNETNRVSKDRLVDWASPSKLKETPGLDSDLNAYDVVYYAGDANAGSKAIAVNRPTENEH